MKTGNFSHKELGVIEKTTLGALGVSLLIHKSWIALGLLGAYGLVRHANEQKKERDWQERQEALLGIDELEKESARLRSLGKDEDESGLGAEPMKPDESLFAQQNQQSENGGEAAVAHAPSPPLPEDTNWLKLAASCGRFMDELDKKKGQLNEDGAAIADLAYCRLEEILTDNGAELIEETAFDIAKHICEPPRRVAQGNLITETITPGLCKGERVFRRAKVRVQEIRK